MRLLNGVASRYRREIFIKEEEERLQKEAQPEEGVEVKDDSAGKRECPNCHRMFKPLGIASHMRSCQ
jgi:hypothetical protein